MKKSTSKMPSGTMIPDTRPAQKARPKPVSPGKKIAGVKARQPS